MNSRKGDGIKSLVCIFEDTTICLIAFSNLEKMIVNIKKNIADTLQRVAVLFLACQHFPSLILKKVAHQRSLLFLFFFFKSVVVGRLPFKSILKRSFLKILRSSKFSENNYSCRETFFKKDYHRMFFRQSCRVVKHLKAAAFSQEKVNRQISLF